MDPDRRYNVLIEEGSEDGERRISIPHRRFVLPFVFCEIWPISRNILPHSWLCGISGMFGSVCNGTCIWGIRVPLSCPWQLKYAHHHSAETFKIPKP